jgi:hypothetical protein
MTEHRRANNGSNDNNNSNNNNRSSNVETNALGHVQVSSASSLDSFLMELPAPAAFGLDMQAASERDEQYYDPTGNSIQDEEYKESHDDDMITNDAAEISEHLLDDDDDDLQAQHMELLAPPSTEMMLSAPQTAVAVNSNTPEFLYQLTRMLTEDNSDVIEWSNGTYPHTSLPCCDYDGIRD